jgi:prefoldin subunit 5
MAERDLKGRFGKGNSGKPKGAGTKSVQELRATVQAFLSNNMESLQQEYDSLEAKDKLNFVDKMLRHTLPPLENKSEVQRPTIIIQNGKDLPD